MDFATHTRPRPRAENIVPMINVVFLLLIFFLMSAEIAPPDPAEIFPPDSTSDAQPTGELIAFLRADGALFFAGRQNAEALAALTETTPERLRLRADANVPASAIAVLLPKLARTGVSEVDLIVGPRK